jgi:hypothetical protein
MAPVDSIAEDSIGAEDSMDDEDSIDDEDDGAELELIEDDGLEVELMALEDTLEAAEETLDAAVSALLPQAPSRARPAAVTATRDARLENMDGAFLGVGARCRAPRGGNRGGEVLRGVELGGVADYPTVKAVES